MLIARVPLMKVSGSFLLDHQRLEALVGPLLASFGPSERQAGGKLWRGFDAGLVAHMDAEEAHLVPALLRLCERDARVIIQEHRHIRARLAEIGAGIAPHVLRAGAVRDFIDELRAHARSEERLLYRWADARLDEAQEAVAIAALSPSAALAWKPTA